MLPNQQFERGQKNDPLRDPVGPYGHGPQGVFSLAGQDQRVFSAIMTPVGGMVGEIPVINGMDDDPDGAFAQANTEFFSTLTGVTEGAGDDFANQPTDDCADGALTGLVKVCTLVSTYSRFRHSPRPISLFRAGQRRDIADPIALQLMNRPPEVAGSPLLPDMPEGGNILVNEAARRFFELRVTLARFLSRRIWIGSPANNNGEARDITGFAVHINAGNKFDAVSQNMCAAMDSIVENFGFEAVTSATRNIVDLTDSIAHRLTWIATQTGLDPVTWRIAMRPELFDELVKVWPIKYYTEALNAMGPYTAGRLIVTGNEAVNARDDMRNNLYLPIRGQRWQVVLDPGIPEITPNETDSLQPGQYASDIYFIPMDVLGGVPVTYFKYFDHQNAQAEAIVRAFRVTSTFTSENGMFRWYVNHRNGCVDMTVDWSPRLIVRTPQLGARISNVAYQPLAHTRSMFPDEGYFANGGRTTTPEDPQYYADWSTETPVAL